MEFICPACSTRLVVNGERIRGKRVGFVCKACGTSLEVDARSDPPGIQAREKRVRSPRTSSPALAVEVPVEPMAPPPPTPKPRRAAPPPLPKRATPPPPPKRATAAPPPPEPGASDATRDTAPSLPPLAEATARPDLPPIGPASEPSLPLGMNQVPPVELSSRASRPDRSSTPQLVPSATLAAAEKGRRRRVQAWLAAAGLFAALLGGYGVGAMTRAPVVTPPSPVAATLPSPAPLAPVGVTPSAEPSSTGASSTSAPTVISIDELPIANGGRARAKKRKPHARSTPAKLAELDKDALVEAMRDADRAAAACSTPGGPRGTSRVAVTVAPDGRVVSSVLEGGALFGSIEARCVEEKFRAVRVPPFRGGSVTAHKTVRLQ